MGKHRLKQQGKEKPSVAEAKVAAKKYSLYDFRHTFVTRALISGVDPITVANLVGHSNLNMIASVYSHLGLDQDHLKRSLIKMNGKRQAS